MSATVTQEQFRINTLVPLLAARDLALVSVWSPTFLTVLLEYYLDNKDRVLECLAASGLPGAQARAASIRMLAHTPEVFSRIWPGLALISCWKDGPSKHQADALKCYFPDVPLQGKGLLATEAVASIPLLPDRDPVLAINSHFYEFIAAGGESVPPHEAVTGHEYELVVTTGGGLYRYRLGDRIVVTGFAGRTPTLRFLCKDDSVSDLFGEKVNAGHAARVLQVCLADIEHTFAMVAPDISQGVATYTLYVESATAPHLGLAEKLHEALCENPNYRYCHTIGQLGKARVFYIDGSASRAYHDRMQKQGMRIGNIKPVHLSRNGDWSTVFNGRYIGYAGIKPTHDYVGMEALSIQAKASGGKK
jgi:hypothetical protein